MARGSQAGTLATEAIRGEGGILLNSKNERFMKKYYPEKMELGPRDVVARAVYNEILEGRGTEHGGVWLDVTHLPKRSNPWIGFPLCMSSSKILMELTYLKIKWRLGLLPIIPWVES